MPLATRAMGHLKHNDYFFLSYCLNLIHGIWGRMKSSKSCSAFRMSHGAHNENAPSFLGIGCLQRCTFLRHLPYLSHLYPAFFSDVVTPGGIQRGFSESHKLLTGQSCAWNWKAKTNASYGKPSHARTRLCLYFPLPCRFRYYLILTSFISIFHTGKLK